MWSNVDKIKLQWMFQVKKTKQMICSNCELSWFCIVYRDLKTADPFIDDFSCYEVENWQDYVVGRLDNHIHLDSSSIGWGCCCLQVTYQCSSIEETMYLYDQLIPLTPIFVFSFVCYWKWNECILFSCHWVHRVQFGVDIWVMLTVDGIFLVQQQMIEPTKNLTIEFIIHLDIHLFIRIYQHQVKSTTMFNFNSINKLIKHWLTMVSFISS